MSRYTTEVRFICESYAGLEKSVGYNKIENVIKTAAPLVFDFEFPIFDDAYRTVLETKILRHYYTREIGEETVGLWKLRLCDRMNVIMPYYNKLYKSELEIVNPFYTENLNRKSERTEQTTSNGTSKQDQTSTDNGTLKHKDAYSDTPQGSVSRLNLEADNLYLTNYRATQDDNTASSAVNTSGITSDTTTSTDGYVETVTGYSGVSQSELFEKFKYEIMNIDARVIGDLEDLFIGLW